ncbi:MAG: helix-turn-helix domain-containing protein [Verrucomicrobiaceae bacterium]|nr:helix-turn-helix domain-containing protein [Verrucomicrobiaceae bacterium]
MKQYTTSSSNTCPTSLFEGRLTLRIPEVAQLLGVSETTVRRMIRRRHLQTLRILRVHLIPVDQLQTLIGSK